MKFNQDLVKTIGAIALIGIIVVATFLYGNKQRQEQVRQDQAAKQEQERKADEQAKQSTQQPAPATNNQATSATPGQSTATTQTPTTTPATGGEIGYLVPAAVMLVAYRASRRSKQAVLTALRTR